jgi:hypothetical protein
VGGAQGPGELARGYVLTTEEAHLELTEMPLVSQRSAEVVDDSRHDRGQEAERAGADDPWPPRVAGPRR